MVFHGSDDTSETQHCWGWLAVCQQQACPHPPFGGFSL